MEITRTAIKKVSLKNEQLEAHMEVTFNGRDEQDNDIETVDDVVRKSSQALHIDLDEAMKRLRIHLVVVCEQPEALHIDESNVYDFDVEEIENYEVTGYTISGSDENAGVVLTGKKLLKNGTVLNLNTPFTKFEDEENYKFGGSLSSDIEACNFEVEAHFNGKWGIVQQSFDFDIPEEAEQEVEMSVAS